MRNVDGAGSKREPLGQRKGMKTHQGAITHEICCLATQFSKTAEKTHILFRKLNNDTGLCRVKKRLLLEDRAKVKTIVFENFAIWGTFLWKPQNKVHNIIIFFLWKEDKITICFTLYGISRCLKLICIFWKLLEKGGRIWVWIWVKWELNWKVFELFS